MTRDELISILTAPRSGLNGYPDRLACDIVDSILKVTNEPISKERLFSFGWAFSKAKNIDRYWSFSEGYLPYSREEASSIARDHSEDDQEPYAIGLIESNVFFDCDPIDASEVLSRYEMYWDSDPGMNLVEDAEIVECDECDLKVLEARLNAVWKEWLCDQTSGLFRVWYEELV